jgi:hypothetical protein
VESVWCGDGRAAGACAAACAASCQRAGGTRALSASLRRTHTQLGLIAGGLVDGTVNLWNPAKIVGAVGSEEPADAADDVLVASLQKHTGAVRRRCCAFRVAAPRGALAQRCVAGVSSDATPRGARAC